MAYEIPQELEYKEKILFGLTFKQVITLIISSFISLIFYVFTNHNFYLKVSVVIIIEIIGFITAFVELDKQVKHIFTYFTNFNINYDNIRMTNFLELKTIKQNIIKARDDLAVIKILPVNFSIKDEKEQEQIMSSFRKFLNSLDFKVQFYINTKDVNLDKHTQRLSKANLKYSNDYQKSINDNQSPNRNFYLIINKSYDLNIQVKIIEDALSSLNLKYRRLRTQELKDLLANFYGGDREGDVHEYISPDNIRQHMNYLEIDNYVSRTITASGYPRVVEAGFLDKIISMEGTFDISIHIEPFPIETMLVNVNRQLQKQLVDLYSAKIKGKVTPILELQAKDTRLVLEDLQKGKDKLFYVSLYITCIGSTKEELDLLSKKVESKLNSIMVIPKMPSFRQLDLFKSSSPMGIDMYKGRRTLPTSAVMAFFPFTSSFFNIDNNGVWFGNNKNNIPIIRDIFSLSNPNGFILAQSGGGKSFLTKLLIARHLLNGTKVMIIDPQGEYRGLVKEFGGENIVLSRDSANMLNPLDLMGHHYDDKKLFLMDLWNVMFRDITDLQKTFLDKAIDRAYFSYGIDSESPKQKEHPLMSDLLKELRKDEEKVTGNEKISIQSLINKIYLYSDGVFRFLNTQTSIDTNNNFTCFDISELPNPVKPVMMFLVMDYIFMKMRKEEGNKLLVIDEAWSVLARTQDASYLMEIVKTCRKFDMGLLLLNQEVEGLLNSNAGKSVLANSSYTILLRQKSAVINDIANTFHLSKEERALLLSARVGQGLLILEDEHDELNVIASTYEKDIIDRKVEIEKKVVKKEVLSGSKLDIKQEIYLKNKLNPIEVAFLKRNDYIQETFMDFENNYETYLIKKKKTESARHILLIELVVKFFEAKGVIVNTFKTLMADVVVTLKDGRMIAFEIETGKYLTDNKKDFLKKVEQLKTKYSDYYFVLSNRNLRPKYNPFGKVLTKRNFLAEMDKLLATAKSTELGGSAKEF